MDQSFFFFWLLLNFFFMNMYCLVEKSKPYKTLSECILHTHKGLKMKDHVQRPQEGNHIFADWDLSEGRNRLPLLSLFISPPYTLSFSSK